MSVMHLRCPTCAAHSEIRIDGGAELVVLECTHCHTPLLHYHGQTVAVDPDVMASLRGRELKAVKGWLRLRRPGMVAEDPMPRATHKAGEALKETAVDQEDIMDLRIDLETTMDVEEFLKRLG